MAISEFQLNIENNSYFQSLPITVQEGIKQSGVQISSEEDLRKCAENLLKHN